jgi:hypothetical protein
MEVRWPDCRRNGCLPATQRPVALVKRGGWSDSRAKRAVLLAPDRGLRPVPEGFGGSEGGRSRPERLGSRERGYGYPIDTRP